MTDQILYHVNHETGKFEGKTSIARENPRYNPKTHSADERYIYNRASSSLKKPPIIGENEANILENGNWAVRPDFVGTHYYLPDGKKITISDIGVTIPDDALINAPPSEFHKTHDGKKWMEDSKLKKDFENLKTKKRNIKDAIMALLPGFEWDDIRKALLE